MQRKLWTIKRTGQQKLINFSQHQNQQTKNEDKKIVKIGKKKRLWKTEKFKERSKKGNNQTRKIVQFNAM